VVREFARFLATFDELTEIPLPDLLPRRAGHCLTGSRGRVAGARSSAVGAGRRLRHGELASE